MGPALEQLPLELLYFILCKLDGRSLACASGVNHRWRSVVTNLGRGFNIWFRICLKEMGLDAIIAQTGLPWLATERGLARAQAWQAGWEFWKQLFVANLHSQCLNSNCWEVDESFVWEVTEDVTAMAIHPCSLLGGRVEVLAGCRDGRVWAFSKAQDSRPRSSLTPQPIARHVSACTSVAPIMLGSCPGYDLESQMDPRLALSSSLSGDVILAGKTVRLLAHQVYCISWLGRFVAVGTDCSQQEGVVVYHVTGQQDGESGLPCVGSPHPQAVVRLRGCVRSDVQAVALAYNQVVGGDHYGNLYQWTFAPLSHFDPDRGQEEGARKGRGLVETVEAPQCRLQLEHGIAQVCLHGDTVLALSTPGHSVVYVISLRDTSQVLRIADHTLRTLGISSVSCVTCLAVCSNLLAVGFHTGDVIVFNISSEGWTRQLSKHVVHRLRPPLNSLHTMGFTLGARGPVLVLGGDRIMLCQFQKPGTGVEDTPPCGNTPPGIVPDHVGCSAKTKS